MRPNKYEIQDLIQPQNVLVSVSDKKNLPELVASLYNFNNNLTFYSTGGTGKYVLDALDKINADRINANSTSSKINVKLNYISLEEFTNMPEMEGGLVKTLHPKIHAGLLAERGNPAHKDYLENSLGKIGNSQGVYFDILVCNLYPFQQVVAQNCTLESARINIDIGGHAMIRAGFKNYQSAAVLSSPTQYLQFIDSVIANNGITLAKRFELAKKAMNMIKNYDISVADYFNNLQ